MVKKRGRPRLKHVERTASGQLSHSKRAEKERQERELADNPVLKARLAAGVPRASLRSQEGENPIGRMVLQGPGVLSQAQYDALVIFRELRSRYLASIQVREHIKSPGFEMVSCGISVVAEIQDKDEVKRDRAIRTRYGEARSAIMAGSANPDRWNRMTRIVCQQREPYCLDDMIALRESANLLCHLWGMPLQTPIYHDSKQINILALAWKKFKSTIGMP